MSLPALRALKDHFPQDTIYLAVKRGLRDVYSHLDAIAGIIELSGGSGVTETFNTAGQIRKYGFDAGILFTNSFRSALLFKLAGIKDLTGYSKDLRGFLLKRKLQFPVADPAHHVNFYLDLAVFFTRETTGREINKEYSDRLIITTEEQAALRPRLEELGVRPSNRLIGISPSAAYGSAKEWLPERFGKLIKKIMADIPGTDILLFGSAGERKKITAVAAGVHGASGVHNLAGQLSLREAMTAISLCDAYVGNDSGLMHVAAALRVPLTAVFGPTMPHKTAPRQNEESMVNIIHHPVDCSPCLHRDCPIDHRCMTAVTVDEVWRSLTRSLNGEPGDPER